MFSIPVLSLEIDPYFELGIEYIAMARKKTESYQNPLFLSLFEQIPVPLCRYDAEGRILSCNAAFAALVSLERGEIRGRDFFEVMTQKPLSSRLKDVLKAAFQGECMHNIQWRLPLFSGEARHFVLSTFPIFEKPGQVSCGMAVLKDVTQKKALEQALVQTEKMASLGTLATGLAHEVGTPMNVILGRAETLLRRTKEEKTAKGLKIIIEQIDRMTHLIERLLAFARRQPIERKRIDVNQLIRKGVEMFEPRAAEKGIVFVTDLDLNLPVIWGDAEQILQVFVNLFMNALDAMFRPGEIRVRTFLAGGPGKGSVGVKPRYQKNKMAEIVVEDSGDGIDVAHRDKIFDPFFTTKPVGKGTGLGLAVVHGVVREHGGEIRVESTASGGTAFHVQLPAETLKRWDA